MNNLRCFCVNTQASTCFVWWSIQKLHNQALSPASRLSDFVVVNDSFVNKVFLWYSMMRTTRQTLLSYFASMFTVLLCLLFIKVVSSISIICLKIKNWSHIHSSLMLLSHSFIKQQTAVKTRKESCRVEFSIFKLSSTSSYFPLSVFFYFFKSLKSAEEIFEQCKKEKCLLFINALLVIFNTGKRKETSQTYTSLTFHFCFQQKTLSSVIRHFFFVLSHHLVRQSDK